MGGVFRAAATSQVPYLHKAFGPVPGEQKMGMMPGHVHQVGSGSDADVPVIEQGCTSIRFKSRSLVKTHLMLKHPTIQWTRGA